MIIYKTLKKKIKTRQAVVTVMGLGYVGLPLALGFTEKGFKVTGYDIDTERINKIKEGVSYVDDIPSNDVKKMIRTGRFQATSEEGALSASDIVIVCVPTPLSKTKDPDVSFIIRSSRSIAKHIRTGQLIIVESTTYPGTTRELVLPMLEKKGLKCGKNFFLAFSPERIDPGNWAHGLRNIPKLVGGIDDKSAELAKLLYSAVVKKVITVSNAETAEVTKLLENTFRSVNIGLVNEFAVLCNRFKIDVWEVIEAAKTKPFGFMPFYPGPGIGGHCIPADPVYLSWKARKIGFETKMIDMAVKTNHNMPVYVVQRIKDILSARGKKIKNSSILLVGVTYKKDIGDLRDSPALEIIKKLRKEKVNVNYHDRYAPCLKLPYLKMRSVELKPVFLKAQDIAVIVTDHNDTDYKKILKNTDIVFDTRNVLGRKGLAGDNIVKL